MAKGKDRIVYLRFTSIWYALVSPNKIKFTIQIRIMPFSTNAEFAIKLCTPASADLRITILSTIN
jgi:hypothetical protein